MAEQKTCQECGAALPADAPAGVCPQCLLRLGMENSASVGNTEEVAPTLITDSTAPAKGPSVPSTEFDVSPNSAAPNIGEKLKYFGEYELLDEIARGGMGVVYKARQVRLNRIVALKMILAGQFAGEADVHRFHIEAEAAANLDHAGIVPIFEVGEHEGHHYFSMGLVEGESLAARIADGPLAAKEAAQLIYDVAEAVQYAHDQGVIHRDLKPANILIDEKTGQPRVTDFGLAKKVQGDSNLTATGQILGTPSYMPPEQAAGRINDVRAAADVYSLGAVLYAALTGRPPFQADNPLDTLMQVMEREPVSPRELNPAIPKDLETICLKCLEKDRRKRYRTARELNDELQRFLEGRPINARPISQLARGWRWCCRKPVVSALSAAVMLLLLTLSIAGPLVAVQQAQNADEQARLRKEANDERVKAIDAQNQEAQQRTLAEQNAILATEQAAKAERERQNAEIAQLAEAEQRKRAEVNANRAGQAREQALDAVAASLYQQAIAVKNSSKLGRRWSMLDLLKQAEGIRGRSREFEAADAEPADEDSFIQAKLPTRAELRTETVAALLMQDARVVWSQDSFPGIVPSVAAELHRAALPWMNMSNPTQRGVRLIDLANGKEIQNLTSVLMWSTAVGLSPDGATLASLAMTRPTLESPVPLPGGMNLWDIDRGTRLKTLEWPQEAGIKQVTNIWFSPNGRFVIASGSVGPGDGGFKSAYAIWNVETGSVRTGSVLGSTPTVMVSLSADGKFLGYQSASKRISVLQVDSDEAPVASDLPLSISGNHVAFSPDGQTVAIYGTPDDKSANPIILLWDWMKGGVRGRVRLDTGAGIGALAFSPDGMLLAGADEKGGISIFDLRTHTELFRLSTSHKTMVNHLFWGPDGRHLMSSGVDGSLKYWELSNESLFSKVNVNLRGNRSHFAISPDGEQIAVASDPDQAARLFNRETGQVEREWDGVQGPRRSKLVLFSPDNKRLAQIGEQLVTIWDVDTGEELIRWEPDPDIAKQVMSAAFTPEGELLASGEFKRSTVVWNVHTGEQLWKAAEDYHEARLSADGKWIAVTPRFGMPFTKRISIWETATGREFDDLQLGPSDNMRIGGAPVFSPDGKWLVDLGGLTLAIRSLTTSTFLLSGVGAANVNVMAWKLPSGERLEPIRSASVPTSYAFSADSRLLVIGHRDGSAELWNLAESKLIFRWQQVEAAINQIMFTSDGLEIACSDVRSPNLTFLKLAALREKLAPVGLDW